MGRDEARRDRSFSTTLGALMLGRIVKPRVPAFPETVRLRPCRADSIRG